MLATAVLLAGSNGCARSPEVIGWEGFTGKVLSGTQIVQIEVDSNEDGQVDGLLLCDWYGTIGIRALVDTDFDGTYDLQRFEVNDREGQLQAIYWDIGYDGILDVAILMDSALAGESRRRLVYFDKRWHEARRVGPFREDKWLILSAERAVARQIYELAEPYAGLRVRYSPEKGKMERAP